MNLNLTGHHLDITPAIRDYVMAKLDRVTRHFDDVIDVNVVMSVEKLRHKVEVNLHARGKDIHVEAIEPDMYAAIDALADKLDRQVLKHKEKRELHRHEGAAIKRDGAADGGAPAAGSGRAGRAHRRRVALTRAGARLVRAQARLPVEPCQWHNEPDRRRCCRPGTSCSTSTRDRRHACSTRSARCSRANQRPVAKKVVVDSLQAREKLGSTGLGPGHRDPARAHSRARARRRARSCA